MNIEETRDIIDWLKDSGFTILEASQICVMLESTNSTLSEAICQVHEKKDLVLSAEDILVVLDRIKEIINEAR